MKTDRTKTVKLLNFLIEILMSTKKLGVKLVRQPQMHSA